eukprot:849889_1
MANAVEKLNNDLVRAGLEPFKDSEIECTSYSRFRTLQDAFFSCLDPNSLLDKLKELRGKQHADRNQTWQFHFTESTMYKVRKLSDGIWNTHYWELDLIQELARE